MEHPSDMIATAREHDDGPLHQYASRYVDEFPWVDALAIELWAKLSTTYAAQRAAMARLYKALDLVRTPGRYAVLRALYFAPGRRMTQFEIGNDVKVSAANVTSLVDALEKDGHVIRRPHESDRRVTYVELTEAGIAVGDRLVPRMADLMSGTATSLSAPEKLQLLELLDKVRGDLDAYDE